MFVKASKASGEFVFTRISRARQQKYLAIVGGRSPLWKKIKQFNIDRKSL
jgi:hypothetical protein